MTRTAFDCISRGSHACDTVWPPLAEAGGVTPLVAHRNLLPRHMPNVWSIKPQVHGPATGFHSLQLLPTTEENRTWACERKALPISNAHLVHTRAKHTCISCHQDPSHMHHASRAPHSLFQVRVWWPPTRDKNRTGYSGAFWPAAVVARGKSHFTVRYDNEDEERVNCENIFPHDVPIGFGEEVEELLVRHGTGGCQGAGQ